MPKKYEFTNIIFKITISFVATIEAPVNCTEGDIRLYGGLKPNEGILHMCTNGAWGTVCLNSWDNNDAIVACHELGYSTYGLFNSNISSIIHKMISFQLHMQAIHIKMAGQMRSIPLFSLEYIVLVVKLD